MQTNIWNESKLNDELLKRIEELEELNAEHKPLSFYWRDHPMGVRCSSKAVTEWLFEHTEIVPTGYIYELLQKFGEIPNPLPENYWPLRLFRDYENAFERLRRAWLKRVHGFLFTENRVEVIDSLYSALMPYQKHNGNKKPKTKLELQKAMLPWQLKKS